MLNLFSFFKQQANEFRQSNRHRSADYLAGGVDALREASDCLTAHKDVVDLEWVTSQLHAQEKEARELRTLNKAFDESRRTFQSKADLQAKEIARLKEQLATPVSGKVKKWMELAGSVPSLRQRIEGLEAQLRACGQEPHADERNMAHTIMVLRRELDESKGLARVGQHITSLPRVLKALKRVLAHEDNTPEACLAYVQRIIDNSQAVLDGRAPEEWAEAPTAARLRPSIEKEVVG